VREGGKKGVGRFKERKTMLMDIKGGAGKRGVQGVGGSKISHANKGKGGSGKKKLVRVLKF